MYNVYSSYLDKYHSSKWRAAGDNDRVIDKLDASYLGQRYTVDTVNNIHCYRIIPEDSQRVKGSYMYNHYHCLADLTAVYECIGSIVHKH